MYHVGAVTLLFEPIAITEHRVVSATVMIFEARLMSESTHELVSDMCAPLALPEVS